MPRILGFASALVFLLCHSALSAAAPPPLDAYGDLPAVEEAALSENGQRVSYVARIRGERRLILVENEKVMTSVPLANVKVRGLTWINNESLLLTTSDTHALGLGFTSDKVELSAGLIFRLGGKTELVFGRDSTILDIISGNYGIREVAGRRIGYFGGVELVRNMANELHFEHGRPGLYEVDFETNRARLLERPAGEGSTKSWLVDGQGAVAATFRLAMDTGRWTISNSRNESVASGLDPLGDVDLIAFGRDGKSVIYGVRDRETGDADWLEVPLSGGDAKPFPDDTDSAIDRLYVDRRNGNALGYVTGKTSPKPVFFDANQQAAVSKIYRAFKGHNVSLLDWTDDFARVLVRTDGNEDSGTLYMVDVTKGQASPIGYERPAIGPADVGPISIIDYSASDGLPLDGVLTLPPGRDAKKLPVIIFPHGGPASHDEAAFDWWAQAFASRGYAVFQPNFRGSTNRDGAFVRAGHGQWGRKMQTDMSDGLLELAKRGIIDPNRACIMGASFGGYAALAGVTLQQGLYRCAVAVAPVSDVKVMYRQDNREAGYNPMMRRNLVEALGDPGALDQVSPRQFAARADAPILLIHGKDDTVVPFKQSQLMADALSDAGKSFELVTLVAEDHRLSRAESRKQMLSAAMAFILRHNPPNE